jgi:hypothetical protein
MIMMIIKLNRFSYEEVDPFFGVVVPSIEREKYLAKMKQSELPVDIVKQGRLSISANI